MIPPAVPAQTTAVEGGGEVPAGAISHLDFINEFYWSDGMEQPIGDLLGSSPNMSQAGGGFNPSAIVASGMLISNNGNVGAETTAAWTNRPFAIGTFYDELAFALYNGGRIVFTMLFQNPPFGTIIGYYDDISDNDCFDWVSLVPNNLSDGYDLGIDPGLTGTGLHTIDLTLNEDIGGGDRRYTIIIDGGTPVTGTNSAAGNPAGYPADPFPTTTLSYIAIGNDGDDETMMDVAYFQTITVYGP